MYQALYRKYRPKDFDSVVGQDSIVKTLKNSIINNNFSHAYMFFGSRGTGKTTVSKIFARNINCLSPKDGLACGKCDNCLDSFSNECVDIIEIDAASNNGVDEIRELRNNIHLVPTKLKYKVYIIDEFHMLSDGAFNALLKTLEEPPEHVVFILATTDPQKVPETIVSRCQCFSFKKISNEVIFDKLKSICKSEKIKIDDDVLTKISILSDGGLRDAIVSLDKLVSYTSNKITIDDFNELNGIISDEDILKFLNQIFNNKTDEVLKSINEFNNCGKNLIQIIIQLINYCRDLLIDYYISRKNIDFSIDLLQDFTNLLNEKLFDIKKSSNTKIYIEMLILKYMSDNISIDFKEELKKEKVVESNEKIEVKEEKMVVDKEIDKPKTISNKLVIEEDTSDSFNKVNTIINLDEIINARINNTFCSVDKKLKELEIQNLEKLRDYSFDQKIGYIANSLLDCKICAVGNDDFIISFDSDAVVKDNLNNLDIVNDIYNKITNSNKNMAIITEDRWQSLIEEYKINLKNNHVYNYIKEPEMLFEEDENDDIITNSAISLFGEDIVEVE